MRSIESKTFQIIKSVEFFLSCYLNKDKSNSLLIAYSAGPDSTVLLDVLSRLKNKYNLILSAGYFNHLLRDKSEISHEKEIAENNCRLREIKYFYGEDTDNLISQLSSDSGIEAAARKVRYAFLYKLKEKLNCDFIAAAHIQEDNFETLIMRFFSGSGIEGLKGISEKSETIIRPLLKICKSDILEYLKENNITYSVDSTNNTSNYLRNRIRNELIPVVSTVFPGFRKSLLELSEKMLLADSFITGESVKRTLWDRQDNYFTTDYNNFSDLPEYLRLKAIYNVFNQNAESDRRLPYSFLKPLLKNKIDLKSPVILEGGGFRLEKQGKELFWKTDIVNKNKNSYLLNIEIDFEYKLPINTSGSNKNIIISAKVVNFSECRKNDIWLPMDKVSGKIRIRSRLSGDFIVFSFGKKTIKKLFQEMGISRDLRDIVPLLCDDNGIFAVWGEVFNYKNRISWRIADYEQIDNKEVILFNLRQE